MINYIEIIDSFNMMSFVKIYSSVKIVNFKKICDFINMINFMILSEYNKIYEHLCFCGNFEYFNMIKSRKNYFSIENTKYCEIYCSRNMILQKLKELYT